MLIKHLTGCRQFTAGDNTLLREILHPGKDDVSLRYSLAHAIVKPGQTSLPHTLRTSEVYYILEGQGLMTIDGETTPVGPGDTIYIPPGAVQYIENKGDTDLAFLCIVDPAWRPEDEVVL
jgi:mannose-6-phosphate isomerase-like protein (cupin superfamily)